MSFRKVLVAVCASISLGSIGCDMAAVPPVDRRLDTGSKERLYQDYKLTYDKTFFSEQWSRRDGEYTMPALENVVAAYPETRELKHRIMERRLVIGIVGGTGGGIIGGTLGYELTAPENRQLSSGTQVALYSVGGALVIAGIVMQVAWHDPAEELADTYNGALARDLGLDPRAVPSGPVPAPTSLLKRQVEKPRLMLTPAPMMSADGRTVMPGLVGMATF